MFNQMPIQFGLPGAGRVWGLGLWAIRAGAEVGLFNGGAALMVTM